jgi:hypothetical protein
MMNIACAPSTSISATTLYTTRGDQSGHFEAGLMAVFVFVLGPLFESGSRGTFNIRVDFVFDCENFQRTLNSNKCDCNLCPHTIRPMTRKSPRKLDHPLTSPLPQPSASEIYQAQLLLAQVEANMAQKGKKKKAATPVTIRKQKRSAKQITLDETLEQPSDAEDNSDNGQKQPSTKRTKRTIIT